jgi:hypothetical protein
MSVFTGVKKFRPRLCTPWPAKWNEPHPARLELPAEVADRLNHLPMGGILPQGDAEAERAQHSGHVVGVVDGILERADRIGGVADDQGHSRLGTVLSGDAACEEEGREHSSNAPPRGFGLVFRGW